MRIAGSIIEMAKREDERAMGNWTRIVFETQWGKTISHTAYINDDSEIKDILMRYQGKPVSITVIEEKGQNDG